MEFISSQCILLFLTFWISTVPQSIGVESPVYSVKNGSDICLRVQMDVKFQIHYFTTSGQKVPAVVYLNSTTANKPNISGLCESSRQSLQLSWEPDNQSDPWQFGLQFGLIPSGYFRLDILELNFTTNGSLFPFVNDTKPYFMIRNATQFDCALGSYFQCLSQQTSMLVNSPFAADSQTQLDVHVTLSGLRAEAFRSSPDDRFVGSMYECFADFVPNKIVPIVVGVALAAMIIIALATFIIGSRRRQQGYREI